MAGALENRGKNRGLALAQKKAKEKNKTGALTLRGQDRDEKNRGGLAGGIGYVAGNLGLGLANVGEGILDISMAAGDLLQGDTDMAKYRFLNNMSGNAQKRLQEDYNPNGAMKLAGDVASGIGNSLTFLIPYAGPYLAAAGYMGMGVSSAAERTGDVGAKELGYGVVSGSMEFLMDKFIGASGRAYKSIGASITRKMGREAAEAGAKATAKLAGKSFGKAVLTETLKGAAGEALEEASQEALDPVLLRLFNIDENAKLDWKNVAYAGLVGGLSGGLMTAGPAAINYKSAASAGKSIRESGETAEFLEHARLVVKGAQRKQANLTAKKDAAKAAKETKTEDGTDTAKAEKTKGGIGTFIQGRRDAKASRRVAQLAETVQKNLTAYEGYLNKADKTAKELEISDAILGEMRGNVFLLENAALLESYEEAILELSDEDKAELVADINARAKASGAEKTDYTVEDLNKDTDGILAGVAGNYLLSENYGRYLRGNQEAKAADTSESPAEAAEGEETVAGEEVGAPVKKANEKAAWTNPGTTEDEKAIYKVAHDFGLSKTETNMMLASFKKGTAMDADTFAKAYSEGIFRGRRGQNPADVTPGTLLASMNPYERQEAFEAGRTSAIETEDLREAAAKQKKAPARQADKQGKTSFVTLDLAEGVRMRDLSPEAYQTYNAAKVIGEALHTDIVLHSTLGDVNGKKQNGYYNRKTGEIHIALDAGRGANGTALFTLAHEVTHYIKEWSPRKYQALADFVSERISGELDVLVERKVNLLRTLPDYKNMTVSQLEDAAHEEVVADSMETVLSDGNVLEDLATYDNSIWQKVKSWITKAIKNIKAVYESLSPNSQAAKVLSETMTDMEKLERLFTEGVRDAGERAAEIGKTVGNGNEIIYSSTENFKEDKYFKSQMAKWENLKHGSYVKVGTLGEGSPLCQVGMPSGTIRYDVDKLKRNMTDHDDYLTVELLNEIPNILANPVAISEYSQENTISVFGDVFVGKSPMMVGVTISHDRAGNEISKVRTYNTRRDVGNLITDETVLYLGEDKKRTREWFQACGIQVPLGGTKFGFIRSIAQRKYSVNSKFSISENIPSTLSAEDQNLLFDADFYERYENENREPITETVKELETIKESEAFATMSDDEMFELNAKLKAKRAGYDTVYDYYVETEKERMAEEYRRYVQTGRSNRTSRTLEEKRKKAQKERTLRSDMDSATPLQNAQYKIIQETNPMWDEYHTGIRSPKEIKTFAEVAEDHDSFTWGDFTREDAEKALREGKVRVYSSYAIKNGVFVSTSYNQALQYAGNNPDGVHTRVVALDSVAWINGDEGQYAKVYKDDGISYSIDDSGEVSGSEAADNQAALEKFGTTTDFEQAGFAMADGRMLKLSQYGGRGVQHRVIEGIYEDTKGDEAIARFIQNGNVRISAASPGIEISAEKPLTTNQLNVISRFAAKSLAGRGSFYLDITGRDGESIASVAYDDRQSAAAILEDIKDYYKRGRVPEESRYLYSIDEEGDVSENAADTNVGGNKRKETPFEKALRRSGLAHLIDGEAEAAEDATGAETAKAAEATDAEATPTAERDTEAERRERIRAHETLANALMEAAQNEQEYRLVKNYQRKAADLADAEVRKEDLRKKTAEVNREIDTLQSKLKGVDKTMREPWVMTALTDAQKRKGELLDEMDALDEKLRAETDKLLSLASAKQLRKLIRAERSKAAAMERSAERARQREMDSKEWAKETVKKAREESNEKVKKARQEAQDYKAAVYKTSMDKVYKARREATDYKQAVYRTAYAKADEKNQKYRDRLDEMAKRSMERREITIRMREARRVLGYLNTMLYHPTKQKHVPESLQALVDKALRSADPKQFGINRDHIREMSELAGKIRKLEIKAGRTTDEQKTLDKMKTKYEKLEADTISVKRQAEALMTAFEQYVTSTTDGEQIDKNMLEGLRQTVTEIEEAPLNEMTLKSLEAVEKIYTVIYHQVNTANQAFATEKAANIDEMSTKANTQVKNAKALKFLSPKGKEWVAMDGIHKYFWKNMKPLTVFEAIGSDELMSIFKRVLKGEDVWITDILEAKKVLDKAKKEFGYNKWNLKERREVTTADGSKVSLTLGEMMSLYAYMFREQAEEHLSVGGFVFAPDAKAIEKFKGSKALYKTHLNDQTPHRMRKQDIDKMSEMLTEEQRSYAKAVQEYLTKLGAKGNEVSRKLYGIDLFKETAYFPIKSSHDYIETSTGPSGDPNIKSRGTFKETVPGAGNPIVLEDFMEVVGNHVNTMATYHAFVLPVEDLTRVWNYTPVNIKRDENGKAILDENGMPVADTKGEAGYNSLKAEITKKYGKEANDYILQLLRDLNGGARRESASSILDKGITAFKRSATMLSLSTIVQQPTSIIRAMAYVDAKHFKGASFVPWETVKKYAPVAAIKEVGGHDTNTGARTVDYINAKEYDSIKDAAKAAVKPEIYGGDPNVRAEAFGWLTGKADEISWRYMFGAIINEQAERLGKPKDSEAVLKAAGERFADVVRHTQVYDSTLTRSEYMRSKDGLMKMATAFGAEPTTVISMAVDAIIKAERGDKTFFRKSAAGIAFSIIANAAVVSLIYAMRDDDEDETIPEKYVQSLTSELIEGFNPLEYLPIARDIMSMFKGYEIERSDMALIGNLMEQVELITSSKRSVPDKIFGVTGAVSAFFGLPVTNVYRDLKGLVKTGQSFIDAEEQTGAGLGYAMGDAVRGQFNLFSKILGAESGNAYELYKAFVSGDTAHYDRVAARYESEAAVEQALRKELRERDRRIGEAAEARMAGELDVYESIIEQIAGEGIFERNMIIRAINNEINSLKDDAKQENLVPKDEEAAAEDAEEVLSLYSTSDLNDALERGDREDFSWIYQTLVTGKTEQGKTEAQAKAAVKSSVTAYWKKRYIEAWKANDTAEIKRIQSILQSTGLYGSRNDVAKLGQDWVKKYAASGK